MSGSTSFASTFRKGTPIVPSFLFAFIGFMIDTGDVSVIPYSSSIFPFPMMLSSSSCDSFGNGDAAHTHVPRFEWSIFLNLGFAISI